MNSRLLTSKLRRGDTDTLAIHCGDYRFQTAFQEFLNQTLELAGNYDLLVIPGGPLSLTLFEYLPKFQWAMSKWLRFFAEQHNIHRLILIQHQDCAFYRSMPLHLHSSPDLRQRQEQDLRRVKESMRKDFPQLSVELYYAGCDDADRISIDYVSV
ncbi:MAG TPA: carbonic anhydrase [Candidatus Acidoferrales bacterium]|nr:carbonic anhydrase [Candidatus Acidoferrales bacterium]